MANRKSPDMKREPSNRIPAFVDKLWALVDNRETNPLICWSPDGSSFIIKDPNIFSHELLPLYYKHNHMQSFVRMLNMYGFHKVTNSDSGSLSQVGQDEVEFRHPCFRRGMRELLAQIERKHAQTKGEAVTKPEVINKILDDVKKIKGKQTVLEQKMLDCFQENRDMFNEMALLRQRCKQQSIVINKVIQFFAGFVDEHGCHQHKRQHEDEVEQLALAENEDTVGERAEPSAKKVKTEPCEGKGLTPQGRSLVISDVTHDPLLSTTGVGGECALAIPQALPMRAISAPSVYQPSEDEDSLQDAPCVSSSGCNIFHTEEDYANMTRNIQNPPGERELIPSAVDELIQQAESKLKRDRGVMMITPQLKDLIEESCSSQEELFRQAEAAKLRAAQDNGSGSTASTSSNEREGSIQQLSTPPSGGGKIWMSDDLTPEVESIKKDLENLQGVISCDRRGLGSHHEPAKLKTLFDHNVQLHETFPEHAQSTTGKELPYESQCFIDILESDPSLSRPQATSSGDMSGENGLLCTGGKTLSNVVPDLSSEMNGMTNAGGEVPSSAGDESTSTLDTPTGVFRAAATMVLEQGFAPEDSGSNSTECLADQFLSELNDVSHLQKLLSVVTAIQDSPAELSDGILSLVRVFIQLLSTGLVKEIDIDQENIVSPEDAYLFHIKSCYVDTVNLLRGKLVTSAKGKQDKRLKIASVRALLELASREYPVQDATQVLYDYLVRCICSGGWDATKDMEDRNFSDTPTTQLPYLHSSRRHLSRVWLALLSSPQLTPSQARFLLPVVAEEVIPFLPNPMDLTGFFVNALNHGGITAMLSLQGLFTLMTKHHLDYPDFYAKLYSLLTPAALDPRRKMHRAKFFQLLGVFLSSTHLPLNLVAAFVKRLSRLSLTASPDALFLLLPFIGDILIRHRELEVLIHRQQAVPNLPEDPFDESAEDPYLSGALESSLWEVATMRRHVLPSIAALAEWVEQPLPRVEWDLRKRLKTTPQFLFDSEVSRVKNSEVPLNFRKPSSALQGLDKISW
ncbi:unnamed protein product [Cyprideis torosa]|uniref:Uncharacterized protein n=1 Tax=Cyprideis torosa TaxID=163714 RepID=A0A7R8WMF9_9CRUS|nr:unnamed protein product [Cyprideis torosa]CAG0899332.1 unnamed protein product [Cyprideis torosa]